MPRTIERGFWCVPFVAFLLQGAWAGTDAPTDPAAGRAREAPEFLRCRALADDGARLNCFDRAAAALEQSLHAGEVVLVEKARVQQERKARFGLPDEHKDMLGDKEAGEIRGTIREARSTANGWVVRLDDNSTWQQVDSTQSAIDPRAGLEVTIRRAALGSYRLVLSPHAAFKVKRVR
jgi:hypothetical protein